MLPSRGFYVVLSTVHAQEGGEGTDPVLLGYIILGYLNSTISCRLKRLMLPYSKVQSAKYVEQKALDGRINQQRLSCLCWLQVQCAA